MIYDSETDTLTVIFVETPVAESDEDKPGVMLKPRLINSAFIIVACLLTACSLFPFGPPPPRSYSVSLSDVDNDGDVDAVVGNGPGNIDYSGEPNSIWLNDGSGHFTDAGQRLIGSHGTNWDVTHAVALGDLDGDGDTDVIFGNALQSPNTVWLNDGAGRFKLHGEYQMKPHNEFGYSKSEAVALGDLDLDGDLDAYVGNCCRSWWAVSSANTIDAQGYSNAHNMVWLNDGDGRFTDSGQRLGNRSTGAVALGDLDGDGDLDAFEVNRSGRPEFDVSDPSGMVWFNDGTGHFTDNGQRLGNSYGYAVALGDVDGDGDLDAFVGNDDPRTSGQANKVWLNDGTGHFADSEQNLGHAHTRVVALIDVEGDGDLDAFVDNATASQIWLNDGTGRFLDSGQRLSHTNGYIVNVGDVDGDGDADVFATHFDKGYRVLFNDGTGHFDQGNNWRTTPACVCLTVSGAVILLCLVGWRIIRRRRQG